MTRIFILLQIAAAVELRSDSYQSNNPEVRLAKQRLLSMEPTKPGIRYRTGVQLTNLVDVDGSIKNLEGSVATFQNALSKVAGIIDMTGQSNGLQPQMKALLIQIKALDAKLLNLHRRASSQISSLYMHANAIPAQLSNNLQQSLDGLVTNYNQQIINQVASLDRQRKAAIDQATTDTTTLARTVKGVQLGQIVGAKKLIKQIQADRQDVLVKSLALNNKFNVAMGIVKSALAGVQTQSQTDLVTVEGIVNSNKKSLVDYIMQAGNTWTSGFETLIARAAKDSAKSIGAVSTEIGFQFAAAQKKAASDLAAVDATVDSSISQVNRQIDSVVRKFEMAIQNATQTTDSVVADLKQPVEDVQDQITTAGTLLSTLQRKASLSIAGVASATTKTTQAMLEQYRKSGQAIESNPGFAAVAASVTDVYNKATADIGTAQTSAETRVAALQDQLGSNDQTVGQISEALQASIDSSKQDFQTKTQLASSSLAAGVAAASSKLGDLANENAARVDELKANADGAIAGVVGSLSTKIDNVHTASGALIDAANAQVSTAGGNLNTLISQSFGGILTDSADVKNGATALAAASSATSARIGTLNGALATQTGLVNKNIADANSQVADLRQLGSSAVDEFYQKSLASTSSSVSAFSRSSNEAVDAFASGLQGEYASLSAAQSGLQTTQAEHARQAALVQAGLSGNLTRAQQLLASVKSNSSVADAQTQQYVSSLLLQFKSGSLGEVSNLKAQSAERLKTISAELQDRVAAAGASVGSETRGFVSNLAQLSGYLSDHAGELQGAVDNTTGAVTDFQSLATVLSGQIGSISDRLKLFAQNSTEAMNSKLAETAEFVNDSRDDAIDEINKTWEMLEESMNSVNGSTAQKIAQFRSAVSSSIATSDLTIRNFTNYIDAMVAMEKRTAASRIAVQRGLLQSIMAQAANKNTTGAGSSAELLARLQAVLGTASDSVGATADGLLAQKASQDAMINMFGFNTAAQVDQLVKKLGANAAGFVGGVGNASAASAADSSALLRSTGLGVQGIVDLASNVAETVDIALNDTRSKMRDSQVAMAALSAETGDLSNITESQLSAILAAMMDSQTMYSTQLSEAKGNNTANIALISGVVRDFVRLVNQTLSESNDLVAAVDANYTDASMKLGSKMDTVIGYISRQSSAVASSADSSAQMLKSLLVSSGPMEDGIRETLKSLSAQQDEFAKKVRDQLAGFTTRIADDTTAMTSARAAATNKLYDALHAASEQFASNAAAWQNEKLQAA